VCKRRKPEREKGYDPKIVGGQQKLVREPLKAHDPISGECKTRVSLHRGKGSHEESLGNNKGLGNKKRSVKAAGLKGQWVCSKKHRSGGWQGEEVETKGGGLEKMWAVDPELIDRNAEGILTFNQKGQPLVFRTRT